MWRLLTNDSLTVWEPVSDAKKWQLALFLILEAPAHFREHSKHFGGSISARIQPHFLLRGVVLQV